MSVSTQKNVMNVLVGLDIAGTAIASLTNDLANLPTGQVVVLGQGSAGEVVMPIASANITNYPSIRLVTRVGTQLKYSARIYGKDVISYLGKDGVASAEQVNFIGYNGSAATSALDNTATEYILTYVNDWDDQQWSEQKMRKAFLYSSTTATQKSIAQSFTYQVNFDGFKSDLQGVPPQVKAEMMGDSSTQSALTGAPTISIANGSDVATFSNTVATNGAAIGDALRLGSAAATTTTPIYIITAIPSTDSSLTANQVRVHTFFQGTTISAGAEGVAYDRITASTNYGMKFTGLPLTWALPPYGDWTWKKVSFHFDLEGFGTSTLTDSTRASKGYGDYRAVAEMEYSAMGNEGALNRSTIPLPTGSLVTSTTGTPALYDTVYIESADTQGSSPITAAAPMRIQTYVFIPDGAANMTKLLTQLDPWMASCPGAFAAASV